MEKEVFGIKDGVLIRYYENEKDDGNNDGMKKIGDLSKLLDDKGGLLLPKGVSKIGGMSKPFYHCESLTSVIIPAPKSYDYLVWDSNKSEISVVIPDYVVEISGEAFKCCTNLTSVSIPGCVKYIGFEAFAGCTSLESVSISEGVRYIGRGAFAGCTSLRELSIPASVTEICTGAFAVCTSLKEVRYGGTKAQWAAVQMDAAWDIIPTWKLICADDESGNAESNCDSDGRYFLLRA